MFGGLGFVVRRVGLQVNENAADRAGWLAEPYDENMFFPSSFASRSTMALFLEIFGDAVEQTFPERGVRDLAAAEHDRDLDFSAVEKKDARPSSL